jgi:hypothetical protein
MVSEAIARGDVNAINYFIAQKYVEAFGKLAESPQAKTVIVPADMASLIGSIAGIGTLVRTAAEDNARPTPPRPAPTPRPG